MECPDTSVKNHFFGSIQGEFRECFPFLFCLGLLWPSIVPPTSDSSKVDGSLSPRFYICFIKLHKMCTMPQRVIWVNIHKLVAHLGVSCHKLDEGNVTELCLLTCLEQAQRNTMCRETLRNDFSPWLQSLWTLWDPNIFGNLLLSQLRSFFNMSKY